ncbi:glycolate oxidase, subunit GlcD [Dissulfuribacter thermophilus]|uniref:Glycolate oxidase, subunit GlcD n=1 Tax=Dissulfuribacter thermophilus TaxID=1156395 RepID=A0A1B9F5R2_9BACT|nr:FAD-linked oxidase C-terminal domain-containing protein [Dissulfuribacter thermophilus]OCC15288.1 glycolate oxidase, subunit GlcD [Dissulfuribacter thermophilus]
MVKLKTSLKKKFYHILGKGNFSTDPATCAVYSFDASHLTGISIGVCFPKNTEQVADVLSICNNEGIRVFPRGGGSGRTGGCVPIPPGIVVSFEKMNRILEISREDLVARVEPGVITGLFQKEVEKKGLFYPPDPASLSFCTIGGNVATCAGGARAVKYGVTRDYVLGMEVVTAKGDVLSLGGRTVKSASGYSLKDLMVGSEGTLSLFTEITVKLVPKPRTSGVMVAFFKSAEDAAHAILEIFSAGIVPRTAEFMDETASRLVFPRGDTDVSEDIGSMLLLESDGEREFVDSELRRMEEASNACGAIYVKVAEPGEEERLWELRRTLSQRVRGLGYPDKISEDIVVPRGKIPEILKRLKKIERDYRVKIVCFGHAGDGNLHVNVLCDLEKQQKEADAAIDAIFRETLNLSGRISGEHGVGLTKAKYLTWELDSATYNSVKSVKDLFDPKGVLNPGKVFLT